MNTHELLEQVAIARLLQDWALWRDTGNWDKLRAAYTPDAWMKTTWFEGTASEFVDASALQFTRPSLVQHFVGPSTVEVRGIKAVAETRVMLLLRGTLEGVGVDVTCYGRFVDRLVQREGVWLIHQRDPIYEKDVIAPLEPGARVPIDRSVLNDLPSGYRHLAYLQSLGGARIVTDIAAHNSAAQRLLYAEASAWLNES